MKVLKFYSDTCGPCKVVEKNLSEAKINHESIEVTSPKGERLSEAYSIRSVPTVVVIDDNGCSIKTFRGIFNIEELKAIL